MNRKISGWRRIEACCNGGLCPPRVVSSDKLWGIERVSRVLTGSSLSWRLRTVGHLVSVLGDGGWGGGEWQREAASPSGAIRVVAGRVDFGCVAVRVVRVRDNLVRDVFLLAEEFLQANHGCQKERQLADQKRLTDEQSQSLESQNSHHTDLHHTSGHQWSQVLHFSTS